jgi:hypothetical protein
MGPKFGFGANKNDAPNPLVWAHFGAFLFCIMMGRKMTSRKGFVSPPESHTSMVQIIHFNRETLHGRLKKRLKLSENDRVLEVEPSSRILTISIIVDQSGPSLGITKRSV